MGKCTEDKLKKCKKLIKKCEKDKKCDCKEDLKKRKDPILHREDLLWSYFTFKMLSEMLAETTTRQKIKEYTNTGNDYEQALALDMLQDLLNIKEGTIMVKKEEKSAPGAAAPAAQKPAPAPTKK